MNYVGKQKQVLTSCPNNRFSWVMAFPERKQNFEMQGIGNMDETPLVKISRAYM